MLNEVDLDRVLEHNRSAAAMWDSGGSSYDNVSFAISDALAHAAQRLSAKRGEDVLDVATGTGWTARNVARYGARVTAVDIAPELIRAAQQLSRSVVPPITFQVAPAERLPFEDGRFDRVISTFGVMFSCDPARAASELARVCRKGGRLSLATWTPDGAVARLFAILGSFRDAPRPPVSPLEWGKPEFLEQLLGRQFDLRFEKGVSHAYHDNVDEVWDWYLAGFGPLRALHETLDDERRGALKRQLDEYHRHYAVPCGLHMQREYLITIGQRR